MCIWRIKFGNDIYIKVLIGFVMYFSYEIVSKIYIILWKGFLVVKLLG